MEKKKKKVSLDWDGFQPLAHNRLLKEPDAEAQITWARLIFLKPAPV